ncbi:uncharacterized protein Z519_06199 [Cladophialophora bantiana CBS 173.52]|uniref:Uncharacterized protein n=1 Tax=Cladophialophora bantiana (strain ATCC 10958 / CBS 173.52 / CDC B-1940 / NIH 8579) TaxID=1442370 RepID=A0A0D2I9Y1_CLAB1|nr:uncharacterized protein Z519_06199 [Cladophialophora bantiana CBS 173.52]KIW93594.1 hypothetical protein Z519_06199 [Cladophialophora bantiana CBS 173.52]
MRVRTIITNILNEIVFRQIADARHDCSPYMLIHFWTICRILQGIPPQLGYPKEKLPDVIADQVKEFVQALQGPPKVVNTGATAGLLDLLKTFLQISPRDLQDTIRIGCLCTARALTSKLGPDNATVLSTWLNYYRYRDKEGLDRQQFLGRYGRALEEIEQQYAPNHEYAIDILCNYAVAAHYLCHDNDLARKLAFDLWERTQSACEEPAWTVKTKGMAEAAKLIALLGCVNHENKRKNAKDMKKIRQKAGCKGKAGRKKWRQTLIPPPLPQDAAKAVAHLDEAARKLADRGDWDSQFTAAFLYDCLANLTREFCRENSEGHRGEGSKIRSNIVLFHELIKEPPTAVSA